MKKNSIVAIGEVLYYQGQPVEVIGFSENHDPNIPFNDRETNGDVLIVIDYPDYGEMEVELKNLFYDPSCLPGFCCNPRIVKAMSCASDEEEDQEFDLIERIARYDRNLANEVADALCIKNAKQHVRDAEDYLDRCCRMAAEDPTGQDFEAMTDNAAASLIDARDNLLRIEEPERYAEMKAMGYFNDKYYY